MNCSLWFKSLELQATLDSYSGFAPNLLVILGKLRQDVRS